MNVSTPRPKRLWQISLRGLFILLTLVAVALVLTLRWDGRARRQRAAVLKLNADYPSTASYENGRETEKESPAFLSDILTFDHFHSVNQVRPWNATDAQLALLEDLPNVTEIDFLFESQCTDAGLERIRALPRLKKLYIDEAPGLGDAALAAIGSRRELQELSFAYGPKMTAAGLAHLQQLRRLKSLRVTCRLDSADRDFAWLATHPGLEELYLEIEEPWTEFTEEGEEVIKPRGACRLGSWAPLKRLKSLSVNGDADLVQQLLPQLGEFPALKTLTITSDAVGADFDFSPVASLKALRTLHVACRDKFTASELSDAQLASIAKAKSLRTLLLICGGGSTTDVGMAGLARLPELLRLEIAPGPTVTDAGIAALEACPKLERLRLHMNNSLTGEGFAALRKLQYLELNCRTRHEDAPPIQLRPPPQIADLVIDGRHALTDDGLDALTDLPALETLEFFWCEQLTDDGLKRLERLTQLKDLGVHWCDQTTDAAIAKLRTALPKSCDIQVMKGGGSFGFSNRFLPFPFEKEED